MARQYNLNIIKKNGFTLIELLTVISIISLLSSIVMASVKTAIDKANIAAGLEFASSVRAAIGDSLMSQWSFNEGSISGTAVKDMMGNNDGDLVSNPTLTKGIIGDAFKFDGISNQYFRIFDATPFNIIEEDLSKNLTLSFWIYPENIGSIRIVMMQKNDLGAFGVYIETDGSMTFSQGVQDPYNSDSFSILDSNAIVNNKWQLIVITRDIVAKTIRSYYNGKFMKQFSFVEFPGDTSDRVVIGPNFDGIIDEIQIYTESLPIF